MADVVMAAKIETMAKDLLRYRAFGDERAAAIRVLLVRGYNQGDIICLVDQALERARALLAAGETG